MAKRPRKVATSPFLTFVPKMGWDQVNLEIVPSNALELGVNLDLLQAQQRRDPSVRHKILATTDTIIVKMSEQTCVKGSNWYYLAYLPAEQAFVLVPAWIFWDRAT